MKVDVITLAGEKSGAIELSEDVFGVKPRRDILARVVNWQLNKRRRGSRKTKTRSEVAGTGSKPFRQKGTGRARQGTKKAPQMRGGGRAFGPVVRDHTTGLPKKVCRLGLRAALSAKQQGGDLIVVDEAKLAEAKTGALAKTLDRLGWRRALVVDGGEIDANFARAARNIVGVDVLPSRGANVYDILRCEKLVLTRDAVEKLVERLT